MKTCPECNTENTINAKFCTACGTKLEDSVDLVGSIEPLGSTRSQMLDKILVSEKIPDLKIRTHVLLFAYCESIWELLKNCFMQKPMANIIKSEKIVQDKSDSVVQVLNVDSEIQPELKISKLILIKAYFDRARFVIRSKLQAIKSLRFIKTKEKNAAEVDLFIAAESETKSNGSNFKRILMVAGVAGITAVGASIGISWFINEKSQSVSVTTKLSPPAIDALQKPTQQFVPSPSAIPATEAVQSQSMDSASTSKYLGTQISPPSNSLANQPADASQPVKRKQSTNQQDINRKRLLELKRQLGQ